MNNLFESNGWNVNHAEIALCATIIDRPDLLDDIQVTHEDFLDERTASIFLTVTGLLDSNKQVNFYSIVDSLAKRIDKEHLTACCNPAHAQPWAIMDLARTVRNAALRRRMVRAAQRLMQIAQEEESIEDAIVKVEDLIGEVTSSGIAGDGPEHVHEVITRYIDELTERCKRKAELLGVNTGFTQINAYLGGWKETDFCIVAARPSMGKTAFMLQTANTVGKDDIAILFSAEMKKFSLLDRQVASEAMVPLYSIRNGLINDDEWSLISNGIATIDAKGLYLDDTAAITVQYIRKHVRKIARHIPEGKRIVVFIDYLQLLSVKGRNRFEEVSEISRGLKQMAKELNCCIVALSQLSREVEKRVDKRPLLSDLRESGQLEQDADIVAFLYRDEYYNPQTPEKGITEVIIAKHRNGPVGKAEITFLPEYQKFVDRKD